MRGDDFNFLVQRELSAEMTNAQIRMTKGGISNWNLNLAIW